MRLAQIKPGRGSLMNEGADMASTAWKYGWTRSLTFGLGVLLAVLMVLAPSRASASTAEEVPLLPTLDSLSRAESPLSNGGKWSPLSWTSGTGTDSTSGWRGTNQFPTAYGAYWNPAFFEDRPGEAAQIKMAASPGASERYLSLWIDMPSPGSAKSGYQLRWKTNANLTSYTVSISKWAAGTETMLASNPSVSIPAGTTLAFSDVGGTLTAWQGPESTVSPILSATDSAYASGYAGLEAAGNGSLSTNFRAGMLVGAALIGAPILDDFARDEAPVATAKWTKISWASEIGASYSGFGTGSLGALAGAYWNPASFTNGKNGLVVSATIGSGSAVAGHYESLWLDMPSSSSARSGYEARFTETATAFKVELSKWASGIRTVLAAREIVSLPANTIVFLTEAEDTLAVWTANPTVAPVISARDNTFAGGYAGLEVSGGSGTYYNFGAGNIALDSQPPETSITSGPTGAIPPGTVSFTYSSSEMGSRFECSLDAAAFSQCGPQSSYSSLPVGPHTFRVRATDRSGNHDPTAASQTFEIMGPPSATTSAATNVASTSATVNGSVNPNGLGTTYQFEWGLTTSYGSKVPATPKGVGSGTTEVAVSEPLTGLTPGTTYHRRLVATSAAGTTYGGDRTFITTATPQVATGAATELTAKQATLNATVNPRGALTTYYFEYGPTTSYGNKVPATPKSAGSGTAAVSVSETPTTLAEGSKYHFRIVAQNGVGTSYGADGSFETPLLPEVSAESAIGVEGTEAVLTGSVDANGQSTEYKYEYGPTTSYGTTLVAEEIVPGAEQAETEEGIVELQPETTYHYRVVATSKAGSDTGPDRTFTTSKIGIGSAENLTNFYGVQWGHPDDMDEPKGAEMARRAGAAFIRLDLLNDHLSQATFDQIFLLAAKRHITVLPHLGAGIFETSRPEWKGRVEAAVRRYGRNGEFWQQYPSLVQYAPSAWEVWNEPNYIDNGFREEPKQPAKVSPEAYGALLQETAEAVRHVESGATILAGGMLAVAPSGNGMPVGEFIRRMGHTAAYDALAIHPYAFATFSGHKPEGPEGVEQVAKKVQANIKEARTALKDVGTANKPIWITELGFPVEGGEGSAAYKGAGDGAHFPVTNAIQRDLLNATFKRIKEKAGSGPEEFNIKHLIYYNLQDQSLPEWLFHTGLVSDYTNGIATYRPAWYAFQSWTGMPTWPQKPKAQHKKSDIRPKRLIETDTFNPYGSPTKSWIKWGGGPSSPTYGNFTSAQPLPSLEEGDVDRETEIPGLQPESTYHYRVVAENDAGEKEETPDFEFKTPPYTSVSASKKEILHGQPGWAWISGWAKEGEITGPGPGLDGVYVNVNFIKNGQVVETAHPVVHEGYYDTGWVSLGKGTWETRTVLPPQAGYTEAKSDFEEFHVRDGVRLVAKHSGKCMDVFGANTANGAAVMHGECLDPATHPNQVFEFEPQGETGFQLIARHSGRCVDVTNFSYADGAPIQQWSCLGAGQQNQIFREEWWGASNYARYVARHSGKCLDVPGGNTGWVQFQQWTCNENEQQRLMPEPVESSPVPTETFLTIDQILHGSPGLVSFQGQLLAGGYGMANRVVHVEIDNASTSGWDTEGGNIALSVDGNGHYEYRDWRLDPGHWNFRARFDGDGHFAESSSGTHNETVKRGYLIRGRQSNRCLQLSEANKGNWNGQPFVIWDCSAVNGNGQVVSFVSRGNGWYDIRPNGTNKCLDVAGAGTGDGVNLQLWECLGDGQANQHWRREVLQNQYTPTGDHYYELIAQHSGKCADVKEEKTISGQRVWQWGCTWHGNQQWALEGVIEP
jgi:Ricin-type beta-trefoil lectin domain